MRDTTSTLRDMSKPSARNWYEIKNVAGDTAEVFIYDEIGAGFWTEGVTAKAFIEEVNAITAPNIALHINSPGGSVFDGVAIHNALKRHSATVTVYIDGLAASIASIIALAGEHIVMADNALFMIHNPWGGVQGDSADMRKMADVLDKIRDTLVNTYMERTGMDVETLNALLEAETWYTAQEALAAGFIDEIGVSMQVAASFDLKNLGFKHVPANVSLAEAEPEIADTVDEPVVDSTDSDSDGSSDSVTTSDGASEEPIKVEAYVPGVGFTSFN